MSTEIRVAAYVRQLTGRQRAFAGKSRVLHDFSLSSSRAASSSLRRTVSRSRLYALHVAVP